jgi:ribonucleoside-diphosphate reductase subunit M1
VSSENILLSSSDDNPTVNPKTGKPAGMIAKETFDIVQANADLLDSAIIYNRDFNYNLYAIIIFSLLNMI